jgi:hypothetical protein
MFGYFLQSILGYFLGYLVEDFEVPTSAMYAQCIGKKLATFISV